jgi:hypothetical protein
MAVPTAPAARVGAHPREHQGVIACLLEILLGCETA